MGRHYSRYRHNHTAKRDTGDMDLAIGLMVFIVLCLPIYGVYKLLKPDPEEKAAGLIMLVISTIIFVIIGLQSA